MKRRLATILVLMLFELTAHSQSALRTILEVQGTPGSNMILGTGIIGLGDINNDGWPDVAVSAHNVGKTFIYFGGPGILDGIADVTVQGGDNMLMGDLNGDGRKNLIVRQGFYKESGNPLDGFTSSFDNAGDVNGDGIDDIIIGASGYYINGADRGFFGIYSGDTVLTNVDEVGPERPEGFELKQNYPNPFNPSTTIEYTIEKQEFVLLKIFDSLGREVTTLVNRQQMPGNYRVTWNGENAGGITLSSGVYYYQLKIGNGTETKKAIYLK